MRKADVKIGGLYEAKVSNKLTIVKILGINPYGGWSARNVNTGRMIRIKSGAKLRREVV
jgi:hypothetical protein